MSRRFKDDSKIYLLILQSEFPSRLQTSASDVLGSSVISAPNDSTAIKMSSSSTDFKINLVNSKELEDPTPLLHSHAAVVTGGKQVYLAGLVGVRPDGSVPSDFAGQTREAFANLDKALRAVGATYRNVVQMTAYIVDWKPELAEDFFRSVGEAAQSTGQESWLPPAALIGVAALASPDFKVELLVTAAISENTQSSKL